MMLPGLVIGLSVLEFAHAWSAYLLGDGYARRLGRVSLTPFRHLSLAGTLAIFLLAIGWGKPVPVNLYNFRRPRRDYLLTSLAGPAANLLIVGLCAIVMALTADPYGHGLLAEGLMNLAYLGARLTAIVNVVLAVLNLLPIPPLDGSKIWPCVIPGMKLSGSPKLRLASFVLLMWLVWSGNLSFVFDYAFGAMNRVMPDTVATFTTQYELGEAAYERESYAEAELHATRAMKLNSQSHAAVSLRAYARWWAGDLEGALTDIDAAIALEPTREDYHTARAQLLESPDRAEETDVDKAAPEPEGGTSLDL
jgi:Zn-dependent protease